MVRHYSKLLPLFGVLFTLSAAKADIKSLDGKWQTNCYVESSQHLMDTIVIKGGAMSMVMQGFNDGCATPSMAVQVDSTYQIGAGSTHALGADDIDITASKIILTYYNPSVIGQLKQVKFCGISDWEAGVAQDITGKTCGTTTLPKTGDRSYDIVELFDEKTLMTGNTTKEFDGSTPQKRPQEININKLYIKH